MKSRISVGKVKRLGIEKIQAKNSAIKSPKNAIMNEFKAAFFCPANCPRKSGIEEFILQRSI